MSPPLVVASNRGPLTFERDEAGELAARRGSGGLVTALSGALLEAEGVWVAAAMSDGDREMVAASTRGREPSPTWSSSTARPESGVSGGSTSRWAPRSRSS